MARKRDPLMEDDYGIDFDPGGQAAVSKLPNNVTGGAELLTDYMQIPVDRIKPYSRKHDGDFATWPDDKFEELVESVRQHGVLEAVTVRICPDDEDMYEMLAGEHRWKAAIRAGLETIPAKVLRICSDETADSIFYLTNILRRELSLRDKILGWSHYLKLTSYQRGEKSEMLSGLVEAGLVPKALQDTGLGDRQIHRYARLSLLRDEFISAAEKNELSIRCAEKLSYISREKQADLVPYIKYIRSEATCNLIRELSQKDDRCWTREALENLLVPSSEEDKEKKNRIAYVMKSTKPVFRRRLNPLYYEKADEILDEALTMYFDQHPECEAPHKKRKKPETNQS